MAKVRTVLLALGAVFCTGAASLTWGLSVAAAADQTLACDNASLASAFASGGSYAFAANCSLNVASTLTLASGTDLSIDANGYTVSFDAATDANQPGTGGGLRFAIVAGDLSLSGITLSEFTASGSPGTTGTNGAAGTDGSTGGPGAAGTNGTAGGDGTPGGDGTEARGGGRSAGPRTARSPTSPPGAPSPPLTRGRR